MQRTSSNVVQRKFSNTEIENIFQHFLILKLTIVSDNVAFMSDPTGKLNANAVKAKLLDLLKQFNLDETLLIDEIGQQNSAEAKDSLFVLKTSPNVKITDQLQALLIQIMKFKAEQKQSQQQHLSANEGKEEVNVSSVKANTLFENTNKKIKDKITFNLKGVHEPLVQFILNKIRLYGNLNNNVTNESITIYTDNFVPNNYLNNLILSCVLEFETRTNSKVVISPSTNEEGIIITSPYIYPDDFYSRVDKMLSAANLKEVYTLDRGTNYTLLKIDYNKQTSEAVMMLKQIIKDAQLHDSTPIYSSYRNKR